MPGFKSIIGQEDPIRFLTILLQKGKIPNALLFTGPKGVGKDMAAISFAMAANCVRINKSPQKISGHKNENDLLPAEPCGICKNCRKFDSGSHPDFIRLNPEGRVTKISQIRDLRQILSLKPFEARLRVVVISEAQTLNQEASNALLKVLEEPPHGTILILIAEHVSGLIATIVSRCQHVRFNPVPAKLLASELAQNHAIDPKEAELLAAMANGSFFRALALKNSEWMFRRNWIIEEIEKMDNSSTEVRLALAEKISKIKDKEDIHDLLEIMKTWYRDLLIAKYCPDKVINKDLMESVHKNSRRYTQQMLLKSISAVDRVEKEIDANVNIRLVLENFFLTPAEKKRDNR